MKKMTEATSADLRYSDLIAPLVKWIRSNWNWKGLKPKGYKKYLASYEDYQDMEEIKVDSFVGIVNNNVMSLTFPEHTSIPHVAYDDTNQGRDPLTVLISASVTYGMSVEIRRNELHNKALMEQHNGMIDTYIQMSRHTFETLPIEQKESSRAFFESMVRCMEHGKLQSYNFK